MENYDEGSAKHFRHLGRLLMSKDPFKERSIHTEDRKYRELFGCSFCVKSVVWNLLKRYDLIPNKSSPKHLIWSLMFVKAYGKKKRL